MLKALIFDVDGTVAETEDIHLRAFNYAFARHGVRLAWDARAYRRLLRVPGGKERIAHAAAAAGVALGEDDIAAIHATKTHAYRELLAGGAAPWRPGVRRLMDEARALGLRVALATTTTPANIDPLFAPVLGSGWRDRLDAVVAGDQVGCKKPAPDCYREALRRLALAPGEAVAFEDARVGVESARACGIPVIATPGRWLADDDFTGANLVLPDLGEPAQPWARPHPALGGRWLTARGLLAWHAALEVPCTRPA